MRIVSKEPTQVSAKLQKMFSSYCWDSN